MIGVVAERLEGRINVAAKRELGRLVLLMG